MVVFYTVHFWLSNVGSFWEDCCGWKFERLKCAPSCRKYLQNFELTALCYLPVRIFKLSIKEYERVCRLIL